MKIRTQIYLTEREHKQLHSISRRTGTSLSELIRTAIDRMIEQAKNDDRLALVRQARGIWKDRADLPDFSRLRRELERV